MRERERERERGERSMRGVCARGAGGVSIPAPPPTPRGCFFSPFFGVGWGGRRGEREGRALLLLPGGCPGECATHRRPCQRARARLSFSSVSLCLSLLCVRTRVGCGGNSGRKKSCSQNPTQERKKNQRRALGGASCPAPRPAPRISPSLPLSLIQRASKNQSPAAGTKEERKKKMGREANNRSHPPPLAPIFFSIPLPPSFHPTPASLTASRPPAAPGPGCRTTGTPPGRPGSSGRCPSPPSGRPGRPPAPCPPSPWPP